MDVICQKCLNKIFKHIDVFVNILGIPIIIFKILHSVILAPIDKNTTVNNINEPNQI